MAYRSQGGESSPGPAPSAPSDFFGRGAPSFPGPAGGLIPSPTEMEQLKRL
ncbi:hypothetical protein Slala02_41470 [Streptomyces lavendulae subsp. lavendulae]|nr:hypothetical protein Slala01_74510 [Streptomyces lavendulae subsp. lavendulae]GLX28327.1 hypothetical protein Slala02_41470 [Streptomyces lavendulae subsp. lavendulae]